MKLVAFNADVTLETEVVIKEIGAGHVVVEAEGRTEILSEGARLVLRLRGNTGQSMLKELAADVQSW